jgi:hypothetical protein
MMMMMMMMMMWMMMMMMMMMMCANCNTAVLNFHLQYFNKEAQLWAADPNQKYGVGDLVLIKKLPEPQSADVRHYVAEPVFHVGNVVDPVTGRRCRGPNYIDEVNRNFKKLDFAEPQPVPASRKSR